MVINPGLCGALLQQKGQLRSSPAAVPQGFTRFDFDSATSLEAFLLFNVYPRRASGCDQATMAIMIGFRGKSAVAAASVSWTACFATGALSCGRGSNNALTARDAHGCSFRNFLTILI